MSTEFKGTAEKFPKEKPVRLSDRHVATCWSNFNYGVVAATIIFSERDGLTLSYTRGAQDASTRSEECRYLPFNHEAVIAIAYWRMMKNLNLRRVINPLTVFKTVPLNHLGNHPCKWSRMQDLNLRLLAPKASVLPNCTNSRRWYDGDDDSSNRIHRNHISRGMSARPHLFVSWYYACCGEFFC